MKKYIIFLGIYTSCFTSFSQEINMSNSENLIFVQNSANENTVAFKKIFLKMYETKTFVSAKLNNTVEVVFIRYNIYKDEMEFLRNDKVFYLKKYAENIVHFLKSNNTYGIFRSNGDLGYFLVHNTGETLLLSKKVIRYYEAKIAASSYAENKPASFKRKSDKLFIKFKDDTIVEVSKNKKQFYKMFGQNGVTLKKYVKNNKLNIKDIADLKKIVVYFNTL